MIQLQKTNLKKFGFRFLVVFLLFLCVRLTTNQDGLDKIFDLNTLFYFSSAFILTMLTWEVNDWIIRVQLKKTKGLGYIGLFKIFGITFSILAPAAALIYYLGIYQWDEICQITTIDKALQFRTDWLRAMLLGFGIMVFNLLYFSIKQKTILEQEKYVLQKEIVTSKYSQLKSQISPHFLFNSLNTLTSLMYEDRDMASDFVARLASTYRYILDNKEENIVSLEKELNFLNSFNFMMNVRFENSIVIETNIVINANDFYIPTLALQMLVENAIKHNYFSKEKPLTIKIYTVGEIAIVVENNLLKRQPEEETTGLGIINIKKRYSFYTNQEVIIEEHNETFKVTMPLLGKNVLDIPVLAVS